MENSNCRLTKIQKILTKKYKNTHKESTANSYVSCLNKVCNYLRENYQLESLNYSDVIEMVTDWQDQYKHSTINNRLTHLRNITQIAEQDGVINKDPCEKLKNLKRDFKLEEKLPFTEIDFKLMRETPTDCPSGKALALFERLTGLRIQESVALCWSDVDLKKRKLHIRRACAIKCYTRPKTRQSERVLDLNDEAIEILLEQFKRTGHLSTREIRVQDSSKTATLAHQFQPIFINDKTGSPFQNSKDYAQRFFTVFLASAGLAHRGPSQLRHSFASIALTNNVPIKLISMMMGHVDTSVTEAHYARWLPASDEDTRSHLNKAFALKEEVRQKESHNLVHIGKITPPKKTSMSKIFILSLRLLALLPKPKAEGSHHYLLA